MEDTHVAILNLDEGKEKSNAFFAVYDGHDGTYYKTIALHLLSPDIASHIKGKNCPNSQPGTCTDY
jgi:serine/threonine protein phosphatase PrpC